MVPVSELVVQAVLVRVQAQAVLLAQVFEQALLALAQAEAVSVSTHPAAVVPDRLLASDLDFDFDRPIKSPPEKNKI